MAGLRGEGIFRVDPAEAKAVKWLGGYGRIRDVKVIGDDLYFITNNGDGRGEKNRQTTGSSAYLCLTSKHDSLSSCV
ncbi:hypothetical protein AAGG52_06290 [Bacillus licheniformis]